MTSARQRQSARIGCEMAATRSSRVQSSHQPVQPSTRTCSCTDIPPYCFTVAAALISPPGPLPPPLSPPPPLSAPWQMHFLISSMSPLSAPKDVAKLSAPRTLDQVCGGEGGHKRDVFSATSIGRSAAQSYPPSFAAPSFAPPPNLPHRPLFPFRYSPTSSAESTS